jgi:hypothetical protein
MGFLDKLKNYVTGGGAKITLQIGEVVPGKPTPVVVRAVVDKAPVKASKVYVAVRSVETVDLIHRDKDASAHAGDRDRVHDTETLFSKEFVLHGAVELAGGSQHEWKGEIQIPANVQPSYRGKHAKHEWSVLAGIDVSGNDPDSGWIGFEVR